MGSRSKGSPRQSRKSGREGQFYPRTIGDADAQVCKTKCHYRILCALLEVIVWPHGHRRIRTENRVLTTILGPAIQRARRDLAQGPGGNFSFPEVLPKMGPRAALRRFQGGTIRLLL